MLSCNLCRYMSIEMEDRSLMRSTHCLMSSIRMNISPFNRSPSARRDSIKACAACLTIIRSSSMISPLSARGSGSSTTPGNAKSCSMVTSGLSAKRSAIANNLSRYSVACSILNSAPLCFCVLAASFIETSILPRVTCSRREAFTSSSKYSRSLVIRIAKSK